MESVTWGALATGNARKLTRSRVACRLHLRLAMLPKLSLAVAMLLGLLAVCCLGPEGPERAEYREGCHAYCTTSDYGLPPNAIACLDQRAYRCGVAMCANGKAPTLDRCGGDGPRCEDGTAPRCEAETDAGKVQAEGGTGPR